MKKYFILLTLVFCLAGCSVPFVNTNKNDNENNTNNRGSIEMQLDDADVINLDGIGEVYKVTVRSNCEVYKFNDHVKVDETCSWTVSSDISGTQLIPNKAVELAEGNNFYYICVTSSSNQSKTYTVNIYRNYYINIILNANGGKFSSLQTSIVIKAEENHVIDQSKIEYPIRQGYEFDGYYLNEQKIDFSTWIVIREETLFARWDQIQRNKVEFWSSFGAVYTTVLNSIVESVSEEKGIEIEHTSQGSYDEINRNMISAIAVGDYPNIAMGYPDHFATYLSSGILTPLDEYLSEEDLADYYSEYMNENYFYDDGGQNAQKKIYALPFNKSTELLGYNGTFVDYCATQNASLANVPATWAEWEEKGPLYNDIFKDLMGKKIYGIQDVQGRASGFMVQNASDPAPEGKTLLLDMANVEPSTSLLMSWDATDNAFITLTRQWGAEYTNLPDSQKTKPAKKRVGEVLFNKPENQEKVIDMLQYFNKLKQDRIFGTPQYLGGSYSSDAFAQCRVMFMICSSGGLNYNTAKWTNRFSVAPIPYKDANNKQVISQGADICLTNRGDYDISVQTIKALTTGKFQTQWCLETGYYPCAKSAVNSQEYQDFLAEEKYYPEVAATRVAYREGSKLNTEHYMSSTKGWHKFVDPAFKGSSDLRDVVETVLDSALKLETYTDDAPYKALLDALEEAPTLKGQSTIYFVH